MQVFELRVVPRPFFFQLFAMAAAAQPASSAVADRVFTLAELRDIAARQGPRQPWRLNSQALKFFRWAGEDPVGVPVDARRTVALPLDGVQAIGVMEHAARGPGFSFDAPAVAGQFVDWSPAQFVLALRPDVVQALGLEEHGVRFLSVHGSALVDKHRLAAARQAGQAFGRGVQPALWDFILTRGDGAHFALHPSHGSTRCSYAELNDARFDLRVLAARGGVRHWERHVYEGSAPAVAGQGAASSASPPAPPPPPPAQPVAASAGVQLPPHPPMATPAAGVLPPPPPLPTGLLPAQPADAAAGSEGPSVADVPAPRLVPRPAPGSAAAWLGEEP